MKTNIFIILCVIFLLIVKPAFAQDLTPFSWKDVFSQDNWRAEDDSYRRGDLLTLRPIRTSRNPDGFWCGIHDKMQGAINWANEMFIGFCPSTTHPFVYPEYTYPTLEDAEKATKRLDQNVKATAVAVYTSAAVVIGGEAGVAATPYVVIGAKSAYVWGAIKAVPWITATSAAGYRYGETAWYWAGSKVYSAQMLLESIEMGSAEKVGGFADKGEKGVEIIMKNPDKLTSIEIRETLRSIVYSPPTPNPKIQNLFYDIMKVAEKSIKFYYIEQQPEKLEEVGEQAANYVEKLSRKNKDLPLEPEPLELLPNPVPYP